jgi:hypothetical protein
MAPDFERRSNRRPQSPHSLSNDRDKDRPFTGPATSLTHADIAHALLDSPDEGGTLDFSHKNIGDIGETGAEELATIGTDEHDECTVLRFVAVLRSSPHCQSAFAESRLVIIA